MQILVGALRRFMHTHAFVGLLLLWRSVFLGGFARNWARVAQKLDETWFRILECLQRSCEQLHRVALWTSSTYDCLLVLVDVVLEVEVVQDVVVATLFLGRDGNLHVKFTPSLLRNLEGWAGQDCNPTVVSKQVWIPIVGSVSLGNNKTGTLTRAAQPGSTHPALHGARKIRAGCIEPWRRCRPVSPRPCR